MTTVPRHRLTPREECGPRCSHVGGDEGPAVEPPGATVQPAEGASVLNELAELDQRECLDLLTRCVIGRVVFTDQALPAAQPVNFVLDGEEIIFRTRNGSKLAAAARHAVVGFQADDIDPVTRTGWSVLGVGQAYEVLDPDRLAQLRESGPVPWVPGHDVHTISIPLQYVSGRRLAVHPSPQ